MSTTPAPKEEVELNINEPLTDLETQQNRISVCKDCESFIIEDFVTKCSDCKCNISLLSTFQFKSCPKGKW